jgi:hypothetical protein
MTLLIISPSIAAIAIADGPSLPQYGNVTGAIVTLYYYNESTGGKGDMVIIEGNPQVVNADPGMAAPGMFTFTRVPAGRYYLEADNNGSRYFAIVDVEYGTSTANIHIPGWSRINGTATPDVTLSPSPTPVSTPSATPPAKATPGFAAIMAAATLMAVAIMRKERKS